MKNWILFVTAVIALTGAANLAQAKNGKTKMTFAGLDKNHDGIITRNEWRGTARSFDGFDWNGDGVISGEELRSGGHRQPVVQQAQQVFSSDQFSQMDRNSDGVISPSEWTGTLPNFNRIDVDRNGVIGLAEFRQQGVVAKTDRFSSLDMNNDGIISRAEWQNTGRSFEQLDLNHDGQLTRNEFYNRAQYSMSVFQELDQNNDRRISRNEWRGDATVFNRLDVNGDNLLNENEFNNRQSSITVEKIFQDIFGR